MKKHINEWTSRDGEIFNYTRWSVKNDFTKQPAAVLIAVHGLGGSANDFDPLGNHLAQKNIITYAYEMRTQGNDPNLRRRGNLVEWCILTNDLRDFCEYVFSLHPDAVHILAGESMGAVVTINALAIEKSLLHISGLILLSPVIELVIELRPWQIGLWRLLMKSLPWLKVSTRRFKKNKTQSARVSSDDEYEKDLQQAPHRLHSFTLRFYQNLIKMIESCRPAASKINIPLLLLYAGKDIFIKPIRVESFFERLITVNKKKILYPEAFHLLLHDTNTPDVVSEIESWIKCLLKSS